MELRPLEYLVAIADTGSFTAGAAAAHVAQPSISQAIGALERELGLELFVRAGRGVRLTAAGEAMVERARRVLRDVADLGAAAAELRGLHGGRLDVVALPTLAVDPLAGLVGELRTRHPGVTIVVHEPEDATVIAGWVRSGRAELGVTDLAIAGDDLARVELAPQEILAVCPPGSVVGRRLTAQALAGLPLVAAPQGTSTRRLLEEVLAQGELAPNIVVETDQREALVPLVLAGAGTTLLPAGLAREAEQRGAVVVALQPPVSRRVVLLHRPGTVSPAARAMIEFAQAAT